MADVPPCQQELYDDEYKDSDHKLFCSDDVNN